MQGGGRRFDPGTLHLNFSIAGELYDRFMGRYSVLLSPQLADLAGVRSGQRVLDVGCGPGALTSELAARVGAESVAAVDPSEPFVAAARERNPGVDVRRATAEELPFEDAAFDATLAQLVVHFMADPVGGLTELARVTRRDGSSQPASGITAAGRDRSARSGVPPTSSTPTSRTSRVSRGHARGIWPSSSRPRACASWRKPAWSPTSSTRASRTGGSRSPSGSGLRAPT